MCVCGGGGGGGEGNGGRGAVGSVLKHLWKLLSLITNTPDFVALHFNKDYICIFAYT